MKIYDESRELVTTLGLFPVSLCYGSCTVQSAIDAPGFLANSALHIVASGSDPQARAFITFFLSFRGLGPLHGGCFVQ